MLTPAGQLTMGSESVRFGIQHHLTRHKSVYKQSILAIITHRSYRGPPGLLGLKVPAYCSRTLRTGSDASQGSWQYLQTPL